jgi:1-acyl-sn-glycerol-3-phosphate acyltransferase
LLTKKTTTFNNKDSKGEKAMSQNKVQLFTREVFAQVFVFGNLILCSTPFYATSWFRIFSKKFGVRVRNFWVKWYISNNTWGVKNALKMDMRYHGLEKIPPGSSYIIVTDHQSWADIPALFDAFHETVPRFTYKEALNYVPFLGLTMKLLDHVALKRGEGKQNHQLTEEEKRRNDAVISKCLRSLREEQTPFSFIVFAPGTRWLKEKLEATRSECASKGYPVYQSVLVPKAGVLTELLKRVYPLIDGIVLVNLAYTHQDGSLKLRDETKSSRYFYQGGFKSVDLYAEWIPKDRIPPPCDDDYYDVVKNWLLETWKQVDKRLTRFVETGRFS